jgi:cell division protease FtsH
VHSKGKPLASEIDLDTLAASTPGFTGADLSNLVNEAALLAARRGKKVVEQEELEEGIMRVLAGPEKKARLLSEQERKITAYHEMGHALVGHYLENTNPVHKITIVSRGQALGLTISLPTEDKYLQTKSALMDDLAMTLGGRAAEELVFNEITTGAANDLEKVTTTAKAMIMRYGMSEKLGPRVLGRNHDMPFLGREMGNEPDYSDEVAREIDEEIRRVIEDAHE